MLVAADVNQRISAFTATQLQDVPLPATSPSRAVCNIHPHIYSLLLVIVLVQCSNSRRMRRLPSMRATWPMQRSHMSSLRWAWKPSDSSALARSEEHTSELQSLLRISYAVFCLQKKNIDTTYIPTQHLPTNNHTV